jgi:hypothetical protein
MGLIGRSNIASPVSSTNMPAVGIKRAVPNIN